MSLPGSQVTWITLAFIELSNNILFISSPSCSWKYTDTDRGLDPFIVVSSIFILGEMSELVWLVWNLHVAAVRRVWYLRVRDDHTWCKTRSRRHMRGNMIPSLVFLLCPLLVSCFREEQTEVRSSFTVQQLFSQELKVCFLFNSWMTLLLYEFTVCSSPTNLTASLSLTHTLLENIKFSIPYPQTIITTCLSPSITSRFKFKLFIQIKCVLKGVKMAKIWIYWSGFEFCPFKMVTLSLSPQCILYMCTRTHTHTILKIPSD